MSNKAFLFGSISLLFSLFNLNINSQTPGMIFENLEIEVLDPNGDGFISKTTTGFSSADKFSNQQSEIPYVPFAVVQMEPTEDPGPGPNCFFNDFDDIREYGEPMYSYFDQNTAGGPYLLYRIRLSGYAPNSKSYSVFIDVDGKFGNPALVGASAGDPDYSTANPGFEVEIYMASNFGVGIYNIDGAHSGNSTDPNNIDAKDGTFPYVSHVQKAVAWQYTGGTCSDGQEYFYDYYIPWSAVSALTFSGQTAINIGGSNITSTTPLRMVGATIMNPNPGFNKGLDNASLSDWGGIDGEGTSEDLVTRLINVFPPTSAEDIDDNQRIAPRSDCPTINTPIAGSSSIAGTSTEDDGTIITAYYSTDGINYSAFSNTAIVTSGSWSIDVTPEYPAGITAAHYIKATAQNPNETYGTVTISESVSYDDCDLEQVSTVCTENLTSEVLSITTVSGGKGFEGTLQGVAGASIEISVYDVNGNLAVTSGNGATGNPVTVVATGGVDSWSVQNGTGQSWTNGNYYVITQDITNNKCASRRTYRCLDDGNKTPYHQDGAATPVLNAVTIGSTSISGTNVSGATVPVFINGAYQGDASVTGTTWSFGPTDFSGCEDIEIFQFVDDPITGECISLIPASTTIPIIDPEAPVILGEHCEGLGISVSGTSTADDGTEVILFVDGAEIDTALVSNGQWNLFNLSLTGGATLTAQIPSGSCNNASAISNSVVVGIAHTNSGLALSPNPVEGATSISGTASSGDTIRLYIDGWNEDTMKVEALGGTFTFANLEDYFGNSLIYAGAHLQLTATSSGGCESDLTTDYEVPCDISIIEATKSITAESPVCSGNSSTITISNSQKGIMYQVYDAGNNPIGYTASGNGEDIYVSTGVLTYGGVSPAEDPQDYTVVATRMVPTTVQCLTTLNSGTPVTVNVKEDIGPIDLNIGVTPDPASICSGGTIDVSVTSSQSSIFYQLFNNNTDDSLSAKVAGDGNDIAIISLPINGTGNVPVKVTASSGTCTADLSTVIGVQLQDSPTLSGNFVVCEGETGEIYTTDAAMTNYVWSVTGGTITAGQGTASVTVTWNTAGAQTITIDYDESVCGTTMDVEVNSCAVPTATLSASPATIAENGGTTDLTATLSTASTVDVVVTIGYTGTAVNGTDYTGTTTITIPAGDLSASITLTGTDDAIAEGDETIIADITAVTNATEATPQQATVTITDDEGTPTVTLSVSPATVAENGGTSDLTATLSTASTVDVVVTIGYTGTAVNGTDYTGTTTITIPAGDLSASITLTGTDDAIAEGDETIIADITAVTNATEATPQQAMVTITDDEGTPTVTLSVSPATVAENGGTSDLTATLSTASTVDVVVTIGYTGTAVNGTDYTGTTTITIPAGDLSASITLTGTDDAIAEGDETIIADITAVTNATEATPQQATVTITDDEGTPTVTLSASPATLAENGGTTDLTATLSTASTVDVVVTIGYTGTAVNGTDYTGTTTITIPAGDLSASITLTGTNDAIAEGDETIIADITAVTNATEATPQQAMVTITDDEGTPTVTLSVSPATIAENGGTSDLTATLSTASTVDVVVTIGYTGTAVNGTDYTGTTTITIPAGDLSASITLTGTDDAIAEGDETIIADITAVTNATEATPQQATVTITDDEGTPTVTLSASPATIAENGGTSDLTATLSTASTVDVVVTIGYTGTAVNGTDYTGTTTITIPAGDLSASITLTGTDDAIAEGDETIIADITAVTNATEATPQQATVTITDDDVASVNQSPVATDDNATISEGGTATGDLLSNDTDPDGDNLTINTTPVSGPSNGTLTINPDGTYSYTPDNGFTGTDSFVYEVCDDGTPQECATATVTIIVNANPPANQAPVATDDNATISEGGTATGDLLSNDTDPDGDNLTINTTPVSGPSNGTLTINPDGTYSYTPDNGFTGTDSFVYEVCDDGTPQECATATVTITVNANPPANQSPVATDDNATIMEGGTATGDLLANDSDPDGDNLTINTTPVSGPSNGTLTINPDGTYSYTPDNGFTGTDSFVYEVCDDGTPQECATATVNISVIAEGPDIFVPEGFSPNNDGDNDEFYIPGIEQYNHVSIIIFNRWGNKIFTQENYSNDWDGTSNVNLTIGKELSTGTYFYQIIIHDTDEILTGYVYLNR